jgi:hypothetical protein
MQFSWWFLTWAGPPGTGPKVGPAGETARLVAARKPQLKSNCPNRREINGNQKSVENKQISHDFTITNWLGSVVFICSTGHHILWPHVQTAVTSHYEKHLASTMDQTNHNLLLRVSSVNSKNNGNLYINISYIIILNLSYYMGGSINGGSPKWLVYNGNSY